MGLQQGILCAIGLQSKSLDTVAKEFDIERSQVGGLFRRLMKSVVNACNDIVKEDIAPSVDKRLAEFKEKEEKTEQANKVFKKKSDSKAVEALEKEYAIGGTDESWDNELMKESSDVKGFVKGVTVKTVRESGKSK